MVDVDSLVGEIIPDDLADDPVLFRGDVVDGHRLVLLDHFPEQVALPVNEPARKAYGLGPFPEAFRHQAGKFLALIQTEVIDVIAQLFQLGPAVLAAPELVRRSHEMNAVFPGEFFRAVDDTRVVLGRPGQVGRRRDLLAVGAVGVADEVVFKGEQQAAGVHAQPAADAPARFGIVFLPVFEEGTDRDALDDLFVIDDLMGDLVLAVGRLQALDVGEVVLDPEFEVSLVEGDQVDFVEFLLEEDGGQEGIDPPGKHDRDFILDRTHDSLL